MADVHQDSVDEGEVREREAAPGPDEAWRTETGLKRQAREEMSAELAALPNTASLPRYERGERMAAATEEEAAEVIRDSQAEAGRSLGLFALGMAIASLFVWPLLLGLTAAVLGVVSYVQGARALGIWSVTIGLLAAAAYLVFIPFIAVLS